MATIMEQLFSILQFFNNPLVTFFFMACAILGGIAMYVWTQLKPEKKILFLSEDENLGDEMTVKRMTPAHLFSKKKKDHYRVIRFREAFNFVVGFKTVTRWLVKYGSAYTKSLESGDVGPFTLYQIMISVWGLDVIEALKDEQKQLLIKSEIPITVRLEKGMTPEGYKPISPAFIKKESDEEMAKMFGLNIKKELSKEDYIRTLALIGCGVALCYIAQAMGLIGGVAA